MTGPYFIIKMTSYRDWNLFVDIWHKIDLRSGNASPNKMESLFWNRPGDNYGTSDDCIQGNDMFVVECYNKITKVMTLTVC